MRISDWSSDVCSSDLRELRRHEPRYLAGRKVRRGGAWVRLAGDRCRDRTSAARPGFGYRTAFLSRWRETGVLLQPNGRDATLGMGHEDPPGTAVDIAPRRRGRRSEDAHLGLSHRCISFRLVARRQTDRFHLTDRTAERRGGKECVRKWRSR